MDHLPHYQPDERTRYKVRLEVEGEVHWIKHKLTLEECQREYVAKREASGLGNSEFTSGNVFDERGQHIARISYNGRLWPAGPWRHDMEPLAEAPKGDT